MINRENSKVYKIEESVVISKDLCIEEDEKLIILGNETKVYMGQDTAITLTMKGVLENHGEIILEKCNVQNHSKNFNNHGVITVLNDSSIIQGEETESRLTNVGVIDIRDNARLVNGVNYPSLLRNVGVLNIWQNGLLENGPQKIGTFHNSGVFSCWESRNYDNSKGGMVTNRGMANVGLEL